MPETWDDRPSRASQSGPARRTGALPGGSGGAAGGATVYDSPITTRSGRALGTNRGKIGPGYSPYARRVYPAGPSAPAESPHALEAAEQPPRTGMFNALKGLPGKALGYIFSRNNKSLGGLPASQSMADMRSLQRGAPNGSIGDEERVIAATGAPRGRGLPQSSSLANLSSLSTSASLPRLSIPTGKEPRTAHRMLSIPPGQRNDRAASPALSSATSAAGIRRSPSPTRNGLAGSMSAFNFGSQTSPTHSTFSHVAGPVSPHAPVPFGLTSRSPFARSPSTSLFPHSVRGGSPSISQFGGSAYGGGGMKRTLSSAMSHTGTLGERSGSPLNPLRKKQLVWDPEQGLVSRQALERQQAEQAPPLPKNEAERILEVLEGMGKVPTDRTAGPSRPRINVPAPSFVPRPPTAAPYSHRDGKGLAAVLQAREERRRKATEELRRLAEEEREEAMGGVRNDHPETEEETEPSPPPAPEPRRKTRSMAKEDKGAASKGKGKGKEKEKVKEVKSTRSTRAGGRRKRDESVESRAIRSPSPDPVPTPRPAKAPSSPPPPPPPPVVEPTPPVPATFKPPAHSASSRPGRTHSSRAHVSSAKTFSANEEDLPEVEEGALGKIQLKIPEGFSFGLSPVSPAPISSDKPVNGASSSTLLGRLAPPPAKEPSPAPTPSSFGAPPASSSTSMSTPPSFSAPTTSKTSLPTTSTAAPFSFGSKEATPVDSSKTAPATSPAPFSFLSAPSLPAESTSTSPKPAFSFGAITPTPKSDLFGATSAKPSFFGGSAPEAKVEEAKSTAPPPAFPAFKAPSPTPDSSSASSPASASNPFAAFGKPIAEIVKEKEAPSTNGFSAPPTFSFGSAPTPTPIVPSIPVIEEAADEDSGMEDEVQVAAAEPAKVPSFSFGAPAVKTDSPFGFGASATTSEAPKSLFSFGAPPAATKSDAPSFGSTSAAPSTSLFGAPPAKTETPATSTPSFFDAKPVAAPSLFGGATSTSSFSSAPASPAPTFGAAPPSNPFGNPTATNTATNPFGASTSTSSWGSTAAAPSPFGTPSSTPSLFGGSAAPAFGAQPATGFGASASAAPSPFGTATSSAMAPTFSAASSNGTAAPTFSFGAASAAPPAATPFAFGAPSQPGTPTGSTFSFGAPASGSAPAFGGFGAGAPAPVFGAGAAAPAAGSPAPGMFNIGSGGEESPGKRRIAPLRRKR